MKVYETNLTFSGMTGHAVIVEFDRNYRMLFWSKGQYVGCWDLGGDVWFTSEWLETNSPENNHCYEPIMDKKLKYSRVEVLESNDARTKIRWRYACNDLRYRIFHGNTFAEEIFTVYPDGIAVRQVTAYPGDESGFGGNPNFWQIIEWIVIHGTKTHPERSLQKNPAFSFFNDQGDSVALEYPIQFENFQPLCHAFPQIKDWEMYIGYVHLVERPNPFVVLAKDQRLFPYRRCSHCGGDHPYFSLFSKTGCTWRYPSDNEDFILSESGADVIGSRAVSTSFIDGNYDMRPGGVDKSDRQRRAAGYYVETPPKGTSWLLLTGATDKGPEEAVEWGRSWYNPATVITGNEWPPDFIRGGKAQSGPVIYEGYAYSERAYSFRKIGVNRVDFTMESGHTIVNPVFTVSGWNAGGVEVRINGKLIDPGNFSFAISKDELILFVKTSLENKVEVSLVEAV